MTQFNNSTTQPVHASKRQLLRLTREGWRAVALTGWVLAAALFSHSSLVLFVFCVLVAVLVVGAIKTVWGNLRRVEAVLRLPEHALAGRPCHVEFELRNRRLVSAARGLVIKSNVRPAPRDGQPCVLLTAIPPRAQRTECREVVLPERGLYHFGEIELSSQFPFGFLERSVWLGQPRDLLVYPRLGKLSRRFFEIERENHPHQQGRRPGPATLEAEYHGLRDFRPGDSSRWIHWATSARRGKLMVREFEARRNRDLLLLLDPWLPDRSDAHDHALLELAVSFTATLCVDLCQRHGLHLVLGVAANSPVIRHGQTSERLLRELLEQLALVRGTSDPRWDDLIAGLPLAWTSQLRTTTISPRKLDLAACVRADNGRVATREWQRLTRGLVQVDVSSRDLRDYFELV